MRTFRVIVEIGWESNNSEIVEREVIHDLNKIWEPGEYTVHIDDPSRYKSLGDRDDNKPEIN